MQQQPWAQISPLLKPLTEGGAYKRLIGSMKGEQTKLSLFGMPENGKVPLVLSLFYQQKKSIMIVTSGDFSAQKLYAALEPALGDACLLLPQRTVQLSRARGQNKQTQGLRAKALSRAVSGAPFVIIAGVDAARARLAPPEDFQTHVFTLQKKCRRRGKPCVGGIPADFIFPAAPYPLRRSAAAAAGSANRRGAPGPWCNKYGFPPPGR